MAAKPASIIKWMGDTPLAANAAEAEGSARRDLERTAEASSAMAESSAANNELGHGEEANAETFALALRKLSLAATGNGDGRSAEQASARAQRVDDALNAARSSRTAPAIKDLSAAVLARDLASAASLVVAGKTFASKINFMGASMREEAAKSAFQLAAAIGWADGLILLRSSDRERATPQPSKLIENSLSGQKYRVPKDFKTKAFRKDGWMERAEILVQRAYTPLGFAITNGHQEAATILVQSLRKNSGIDEALETRHVSRRLDQARSEGDCENNAIVFAMNEGSIKEAQILAQAGAGGPNLGAELMWAARNRAREEAKMLISINPQSPTLKGVVGQALLELAVNEADGELTRMLVGQGAASTEISIYGMPLIEALALSREECVEIMRANQGRLIKRDQKALAAFALAAPKKPLALRINEAGQRVESKKAAIEEQALPSEKMPEIEDELAPSVAGGPQELVADAIRELQGFDEIVSQMGLRIKALIKGLEAAGAGPDSAPPPRAIGFEVRKMRERAEQANQAIAKASAAVRKEP